MIKRITQKEIAKHLNVSISTVSKALKDSYEIGQELKTKIQEYAKENKYAPNPIALSLKNKSSRTIALIIPEIVHHFFSSVIKGIEVVVQEKGYNLIISLSNNSLSTEINNIENLANKNIDGFILSLSKDTQSEENIEHLQDAINSGLPVVMFDRVSAALECDKVISNDYESAFEVTKSLLESGRKKIGLITTQDFISVGNLRTKGYSDALSSHGTEVNSKQILRIKNIETSNKEIKEFLEKTDVDAIVGVNETFTAEALIHLQMMGKSIPTDVSLVAFSDGLLSTFTTPKLTALNQQGEIIGKRSAELLIKRLEAKIKKREPAPYVTEVIPTIRIDRDSTRK